MYGINDVFDYESDIKNPRKGGVEGAVEAKAFHPVILWVCAFLTIPFVVALFFMVSWQAFVVLLGVLFFVVAYSAKGLRFKEVPILDSITSSLHFVGPLIFALTCLGFPAVAWPFVIAFFLWGMASHAFGAVQDILPDREGKLASIATVFGARATVWLSIGLYVVATVLLTLQGGLALVIALASLAYIANLLPYIHITDKTSAKANKGWKRFLWINYGFGALVTIVLIIKIL